MTILIFSAAQILKVLDFESELLIRRVMYSSRLPQTHLIPCSDCSHVVCSETFSFLAKDFLSIESKLFLFFWRKMLLRSDAHLIFRINVIQIIISINLRFYRYLLEYIRNAIIN